MTRRKIDTKRASPAIPPTPGNRAWSPRAIQALVGAATRVRWLVAQAPAAAQRVWQHQGLRFGFWFLVFAVGLTLLDIFLVSRIGWVAQATAQLVVSATPLVGVQGTVLSMGLVSFRDSAGQAFAYEITPGCTATMPIFLFAAAVLAYPSSWRNRFMGLGIGVPALLGINLVRLVSMAWLGLNAPRLFHEAHLGWWQAGFIVAVGLAWWIWVQTLERHTAGARLGAVWRGALAQVGIFAALFSSLWYLGTLGSVRILYGLAVWNSSRFWARLLDLPYSKVVRPEDAFLWQSGVLALGWVLASVALFGSRLRDRWFRRLVGVALGAVVGHVSQVLGWVIRANAGLKIGDWAEPVILSSQLAIVGIAFAVWTRQVSWAGGGGPSGSKADAAVGVTTSTAASMGLGGKD